MCRLCCGFRFYERAEIRDVIAYLRHIHNPGDSLAFERIINVPKRGIGAATVNKLHDISRQDNCSLSEAASRIIERDGLRGKAKNTLGKLLEDFTRWRDQARDNEHITLTETRVIKKPKINSKKPLKPTKSWATWKNEKYTIVMESRG